MINQIHGVLDKISLAHLNILFLLGFALFGGTLGGRLFQKIKIPKVVGYIVLGIIIGEPGLKVVNAEIVRALSPFTYFALGMIAFVIGGELKKEFFRKYGKQVVVTLFTEGVFAFIFVAFFVSVIGTIFLGDGKLALGLGLLLGAIASATDAASTLNVFIEYKTRGPLTTTTLGIVALDDALAFFLFAVISSITGGLFGYHQEGMLSVLGHLIYEIGGSLLLGGGSGFVLSALLKRYTEESKILTLSLGVALLVLGLSLAIKVDMLIAAMALGATVVNYIPRISRQVFDLIGRFAPPIYVLFFVLVGAALNVKGVSLWIGVLVVCYVLGRTAGKTVGAVLGTTLTRMPVTVRKGLHFCLFSQASAAIGLAILAAQRFPGSIGETIVITITATTFILQMIGPLFVKKAVIKAQEAGLNVTEEDLIRNTKVKDIMDKNPPLIYTDTPLEKILKIFSTTTNLYYPVVERNGGLAGIISIDSIKSTFMETFLGNIILADDIKETVAVKINPDANMVEAKELLDKYKLDYLPVVADDCRVAGFLERQMLNRFISARMMEVEQKSVNF